MISGQIDSVVLHGGDLGSHHGSTRNFVPANAALPPSQLEPSQARMQPAMRCGRCDAMRCAMRRDAIALRNAPASIYFLFSIAAVVDHLVLFESAVILPVVMAWRGIAGRTVARQP